MTQQQHTIAARRVRWTCRRCGDQVEAEAPGDAVEVECPVCGTQRRLADAGTPAPPMSRTAAMAGRSAAPERATGGLIGPENEKIIRRAVRRGALDAFATVFALYLVFKLIEAFLVALAVL